MREIFALTVLAATTFGCVSESSDSAEPSASSVPTETESPESHGPSEASPSPAARPVDVDLWHCGVRPVDFDGRPWLATTEIDGTTAPLDFGGSGTMRLVRRDQAVYTDDPSGAVIEFAPLTGEYEPPPCR